MREGWGSVLARMGLRTGLRTRPRAIPWSMAHLVEQKKRGLTGPHGEQGSLFEIFDGTVFGEVSISRNQSLADPRPPLYCPRDPPVLLHTRQSRSSGEYYNIIVIKIKYSDRPWLLAENMMEGKGSLYASVLIYQVQFQVWWNLYQSIIFSFFFSPGRGPYFFIKTETHGKHFSPFCTLKIF